jgi:hypothetical protein
MFAYRLPRTAYRLLVLCVLCALCDASFAFGALSDCVDATCRITAGDGGRGTGCVFEISQGRVFVLTCAHVATGQTVQCEFWRAGHQSAPLIGQVLRRDERMDAAVVVIPQEAFGGVLPAAVPFAARGLRLRAGQSLSSVGCASGAWSTAWKGHLSADQGEELRFVPPPANGRSGSAIFDADGTMILGLLRARTGDDREGIATPIEAIYRVFDQRTAERLPAPLSRLLAPVQCPGGQCPIPGGVQGAQQWHLLPYRYRDQFRNGGGTSPSPSAPMPSPAPTTPWPTLPAPSPAVPAPSFSASPATTIQVDLGPLSQAIGLMAESNAKSADTQAKLADSVGKYLDQQRKTSEATEQGKQVTELSGVAAPIVDKAMQGDWKGVKQAATSPGALGWLGQILATVLVSVTGAGGIAALAIRFGVPLALGRIAKMLQSPVSTAADVVANEVAKRTVAVANGKTPPISGTIST